MPHGAGFEAGLPHPGIDEIRHVHRDHRRRLRHAVPFQQVEAVLLPEGARNTWLQLLAAHDRIPQRGELLARAPADVGRIEGRRGHQQAGAVALHHLANRLGVGRVRMVGHAASAHQREPQRAGEPEDMKERQHTHDPLFRGHIENPRQRLDVGENIVVRQHHALGHAGASAGEDHRGEAVRGVLLAAVSPLEQARGRQERGDSRPRLLRPGYPAHDVLQIHHPFHLAEVRLGEEDARGQDGSNVTLLHRRRHRLPACGEVEVHRNPAGEQRSDVGQRAADRGGQQHADHPLARPLSPQPAGEQQAAGQRAAVSEFPAARIGHREAEPAPLGGGDEPQVQQVAPSSTAARRLHTQFHHRLPDILHRGGGG